MDRFTIDGTEFGVDQRKSRLDVSPSADGRRELSLRIHGDEPTYRALADAEDSEWSWTLYPPEFYLEGFPVPSEDRFSVRLTAKDCEDHDIGLYLMEHNLVDGVMVSVGRGPRVEVQGRAELAGKWVDFAIRWDDAGAGD